MVLLKGTQLTIACTVRHVSHVVSGGMLGQRCRHLHDARNRYSHVTPDMQRSAAEALDAAFREVG
jgi:hypothetical protein